MEFAGKTASFVFLCRNQSSLKLPARLLCLLSLGNICNKASRSNEALVAKQWLAGFTQPANSTGFVENTELEWFTEAFRTPTKVLNRAWDVIRVQEFCKRLADN